MLLLSAKYSRQISNKKTPHERRFGMTDQQYRLERWSNITLSLQKTSRDCISSAQKVVPSIFLGYALCASGIWKGDMGADTEEIEEMDASELHGNFIVPSAIRTTLINGRERRLRTSALSRERPQRGEEQEILQRNSDEWYAPSHFQEDSARDDEEMKNDFWAEGNSFIVITLNQESNCTCPKEESFPISLKYIDVTRTTHTSQDVLLQKHIEDYWNVDCERKSSDAWTGFTRFNLLK